ncbi:MAG: domain S-box [Pedosphaera sp.]|nr:domain S-box [Pedosphaera sp.]
MNTIRWQKPKWLPRLLAMPIPEPAQQASRIVGMQRNIILPAKAMVTALVVYYLFYSHWQDYVSTSRALVLETLQKYFVFYVIFNSVAACLLILRRFPPRFVQWVVFTVGLLDGLLLAGLTVETGGFESTLFWVFPGLIIVNALSIPLATPQIVLNLSLSAFFLGAGLVNSSVSEGDNTIYQLPTTWTRMPSEKLKYFMLKNKHIVEPANFEVAVESGPESFLLRLIILWLMASSCFGVQLLAFRQRMSEEEAQKATAKNDELAAAGRLAAEIAHQLKNPLGIINNAVFSLQRGIKEGKKDLSLQIEIIREEIERSDGILTQLMGYAQLSEGRVEKLDLPEELDRAVAEVLPAGANYNVKTHRDYGANLPSLLMQRSHFSVVLVNLLQNAREALNGNGNIFLHAHYGDENTVQVVVRDDGPGIGIDKLDRIFEAYFTSKKKGTGLGLAIVKHNMELYGGSVRAESELGKGTRFILLFPEKTFIKAG